MVTVWRAVFSRRQLKDNPKVPVG